MNLSVKSSIFHYTSVITQDGESALMKAVGELDSLLLINIDLQPKVCIKLNAYMPTTTILA